MGELAKNKTGRIFKCEHGAIHVAIKGITLHFTEGAFEEFALMVKEASLKLFEMGLADLGKKLNLEDVN